MRKLKILFSISLFTCLAVLLYEAQVRYSASKDQFGIAEKRIKTAIENDKYTLDFSDLKDLRNIPDNIGQKRGWVYINLNGTKITDLAPLGKLPKLSAVTLRETQLEDLSGLASSSSVKSVDVGKSWVNDLDSLTKISTLERLDIGDTAIQSLKPLTKMDTLNWLNLYNSYSMDGSNNHYERLKLRGVDVYNGNAYKQNYKPGWAYNKKIWLQRLWIKWYPRF